MSTTRRRVNLTLTEMEERFLDAIMTAGSAEQDAVLRYLEWQAMGRGAPPGSSVGAADVVHVLLSMGMDQLENELAEISYAAEAAAEDPEDRAAGEFLHNNLIRAIAEDEK
jgi:hypothetical protein